MTSHLNEQTKTFGMPKIKSQWLYNNQSDCLVLLNSYLAQIFNIILVVWVLGTRLTALQI